MPSKPSDVFQGLGPRLQCAEDLYRKLQHDFGRLQSSPADAYVAFDFFVTAEHLIDWMYLGAGDAWKKRDSLRRQNGLLGIVSHLANGSKHFHATSKKHSHVAGVNEKPGIFDTGIFDTGIFDVEQVVVKLTDEYAQVFGEEITAMELANKVMAFWGPYFSNVDRVEHLS